MSRASWCALLALALSACSGPSEAELRQRFAADRPTFEALSGASVRSAERREPCLECDALGKKLGAKRVAVMGDGSLFLVMHRSEDGGKVRSTGFVFSPYGDPNGRVSELYSERFATLPLDAGWFVFARK